MKTAFYASLAIVPWVAVTLMVRWLISIQGWPVGLVGASSRAVSLPLLLLWIAAFGAGWRSLRPRGQGGWLILMALIAVFINLLWFNAVRWTTATNVGMLIRCDVVFVVLIGSALGLERIGLRQLALIPVMAVGLALLVEIHAFDWGGHILGDAMTVGAAFGFSVNAFIIRHIMRTMEESPVAFYNHAGSMLGFIGLGLVGGDFARLTDVFASPMAALSFLTLGALVALSLPLYYFALRRLDVWKLRMFMLAGPVLTAAVEWPLWGMNMSPLQWLGGAIILASLAILIRMEWQLSVQKKAAARPG
ncbi:MAG: DMT family transporter [Planctomycetaceae bacterium]|nr:DMT family transporter [Planctomycetaceae bacterium]